MWSTTPQERLALGVVALLLSLGAGARLLRTPPPVPRLNAATGVTDTPSDASLASLQRRVAEGVAQERVRSRPLADGERLDPNRAPALELERLPRVGPALAARIVEHREAHGPFRSLADLDAVPGVGPSLLRGLAPHLSLPAGPPGPRAEEERVALDVNLATATELERLPGVGPKLATRIVEHRERHGRFRSLAELEQVPGIGPRLRARLEPLLRVGS